MVLHLACVCMKNAVALIVEVGYAIIASKRITRGDLCSTVP